MGKITKGIILRPIRHGRGLYLPVPPQVARVTNITRNTKFRLKIVHDRGTFLEFDEV